MSTFERLTLSEYDDGPCPWPADVYRTALKAAYAENDRLEAEDLARADDRIVYYESIIAEKDAEIDRLRANALEWVTVTEDPKTLPEDGDRVILRSVEWTGDSGAWSEAEYNKWPDGDDGWVVCIDTYEETLDVRPGDRWAYIPEAPHADN